MTLDGNQYIGLVVLAFALLLVVMVAASEAAVASASRLRLATMAGKGNRRAGRLHAHAERRASTLAALALARTVGLVVATALGIFLITEEQGHTWRILITTSVIVLGVVAVLDSLPRLVVSRSPEAWGIRLLPVINFFRSVFGPVAGMVNGALGGVVQRNGDDQPDETEELLREADIDTGGEPLHDDERQMIEGIIGLEETTVREIMAPRIDIAAVEDDATMDSVLKVIVDRGFSRIPIYNDTIDNVVGIVYAKDLLKYLAEGKRPNLRDIARPPYFIPESKRVDELLAELRRSKVHIAIVVDEYGGTAGMVTIEDLLEEIVGEIQDEYDREEAPIERVNETEAILDARVTIDVLDDLFDFAPEEEDQDYDTVGGFVYHHLGKVPAAGDEVRVDGITLRVLSVVGRRIKKVRATKNVSEAATAAS